MHTRCDLSRLDCRPSLWRPVYIISRLRIGYVTSIHHVAIEYTEIYIYIPELKLGPLRVCCEVLVTVPKR